MKKKICIIDDDKELSDFLVQVLESAGYQTKVYDCATFTTVLAQENFDLILLDGWFDDLDMGPRLATAVTQHKQLHKTPILAMSSDASMKKAFEPYASVYMQKPFDPDELLERVETLLSAT